VITHKIFAGRPRDIEDVRIILLKNQDIDTRYIETSLPEFDSASDEKICLSAFRALLKYAGQNSHSFKLNRRRQR
jgi:hypothetical protein